MFPQELGLQLLPTPLCQVKSVRIRVARGQAPSKLELLYAPDEAPSSNHSDSPLDPVSRYFSASFSPCRCVASSTTRVDRCKDVRKLLEVSGLTRASVMVLYSASIEWTAAAHPTLSLQRTIRVDVPHQCGFLKLLVHEPLANNVDSQVCIQEVQVFGLYDKTTPPWSLTTASSLSLAVSTHSFAQSTIKRPELSMNMTDTYDNELHMALLEAGVELDIVTRVLELPNRCIDVDVEPSRHDQPDEEPGDESAPAAGASNDTTQPSLTPASLQSGDAVLHAVDDSVFDIALREELARIAKQDALVHAILHHDALVDSSAWKPSYDARASSILTRSLSIGLLPAIAPRDRDNVLEIVLYTFGTFTCECLCSDAPDVCALAVSTAERFARMLRVATSAVVAFEGLVALVRVSLQRPDARAYTASLHLAMTIFQSQQARESAVSSRSSDSRTAASSPPQPGCSHTLELLHEIPATSVTQALQHVLDALLVHPYSWTPKSASHPSHQRGDQQRDTHASTMRRQRIHTELLRFVRLMLAQEATHMSFYSALLSPLSSEDATRSNQSDADDSTCSVANDDDHMRKPPRPHTVDAVANRLRLVRLLLQRHNGRVLVIPPHVQLLMKRLCEVTLQSSVKVAQSKSVKERVRLARECLALLASETRPQQHNGDQGKEQALASRLSKVYGHARELEMTGTS